MSERMVLTYNEMAAMSTIFALCCAEERKAFMDARKKAQSSEEVRDQFFACLAQCKQETKEKCGDVYDKHLACSVKNNKSLVKCRPTLVALEECAAKNIL
mmetsp:Transcript_21280/g.49088  ORF Transcript_21280/g.49088 Transcript_21280/m.49088 type:complete len:100 (+) Transcript_21280:111-410(+)|eukprot:CAMPEP_0116822758 /NCGR_PEP_ID=MMETSP0418-20121206/450_1 /TAXON_ID=1158023 /ORGANISM="Astrosyne radiata, Strain 13vi08-1A" /LENGTH=99 /DNA_ID=CAMNT_0004450915 /DNA_START=111 /DNA_END=410 /DNA_ORIENTATION=-